MKQLRSITHKEEQLMTEQKLTVAGGTAELTHHINAGETLVQNIEGHAVRSDSETFKQARTALGKLLPNLFGGVNPWDTTARSHTTAVQAHHGGSILVLDATTWRAVLNWAGIEWAEQFAADPNFVEQLRQNAEAVIKAFPDTEPGLTALGLPAEHIAILHTPITDQTSIGKYVDSIFNACVPIPQPQHTGAVSIKTPLGSGVHNYPLPACDIPMFCRQDFTPFIVDPATGTSVVVVPVAARHSGDGRVRVLQTDTSHPLAAIHKTADSEGEALVLDADHPIAKKAFERQTSG
jgi:Family of unknown function (DUF6424)